MNILTDRLPNLIKIGEAEFSVNVDFRKWISVGTILNSFKKEEQFSDTLKKIFDLVAVDVKTEVPVLGEDFLDGILKFYVGPRKSQKETKSKTQESKRPDFDFELDGEYIYQSFCSLYGIRLTEVSMHWWEFLSLFYGTLYSEETSMNMVVTTRQIQITAKMPREERSRLTKMKRQFALPMPEKDVEMNNKVAEALTKMARPVAETMKETENG